MSANVPTLEQLEVWLNHDEDEHLEFKAARTQFDSHKLTKYCVALANEGGGHIVLGVTDDRPRKVVGTQAFGNLSDLKRTQGQRIGLRIDAVALDHAEGRVLVISVPSRPIGTPIQYQGSYWMRRGEDLVPMSADALKRVFEEAQPDYSAQICSAATMADLGQEAIAKLRELWLATSGNGALSSISEEQLLEDSELTVGGGITYAALVMLGTHRGLGRHLAQAETIFEYRSEAGSIPSQQREEYRQGFLLYLDKIWELINLRNDVHSYLDGLYRREVRSFNETVIREALLNALAHRDYRLGGSIFVRQNPTALEIVSPGGFPSGITADNLLWRQAPRNRRIAEVLARCGLVERAGQGANLMYGLCIQESKALPDYWDTDDYQVSLTFRAQVQDENFLKFLERVGLETSAHFSTDDLLLLDEIHRELPIQERLRSGIPKLLKLGVIESKGKGRGTTYLLSKRFYQFVGAPGTYTRKRGLDKETNKALLLTHLESRRTEGSPLRELQEVLPAESTRQIRYLLGELRGEDKAHSVGKTKQTRWFLGRAPIPNGADDDES